MIDSTKIKIISKKPPCVVANYDVSGLEFCNIVYMCVKQAGSSEYQIPENIRDLIEQIIPDIYSLSPNLYNDDWTKYCYVTIKKMFIQPHTLGNREGWHIDGFKSDQENFIWSDSDAVPTEVSLGDFELTNDHNKSLTEMLEQSCNNFNLQLESNRLYMLDQECVHRPTLNKTNTSVLRTFIKVTYSKELFNCIGNAWNYKLPDIKPTKQRFNCRNHSVVY